MRPDREEFIKGILGEGEEEGVVGEWREREAYLRKVSKQVSK